MVNHVIMCGCGIRRGRVDDLFSAEQAAASEVGLAVHLVDHDALLRSDFDQALRRLPTLDQTVAAIYRGWMLPVGQYTGFHAALAFRGFRLITSPSQYRFCHHLPEWYPSLSSHTARTAWISHPPPFSDTELAKLANELGTGAAIVKDYVKSEKHAWFEACFVPDVHDHASLRRVIDEFVSRRGGDFEGGLVLRQFLRLARVPARHPHGPPPAEEWRIIWIRGRAAACVPGFESGRTTSFPDLERWQTAARSVLSPLFTMDLVRTDDGDWTLLELGDGQVAGWPEGVNLHHLYTTIQGID